MDKDTFDDSDVESSSKIESTTPKDSKGKSVEYLTSDKYSKEESSKNK
jgi:hypothetical protein